MKTATQLSDELQLQMDKFQDHLNDAMRMANALHNLVIDGNIIEEEPPKFKIGDWVKFLNDDNHKLCKVHEGHARYIGTLANCLNNSSDYELWVPQEGDVVVCWDNSGVYADGVGIYLYPTECKFDYVIPYVGQPFDQIK